MDDNDLDLSFIAPVDLIEKLGLVLASKLSTTVGNKRKRSAVGDSANPVSTGIGSGIGSGAGCAGKTQNSDRVTALQKWMGCDDIYGGIIDVACVAPSSSSSVVNSSMFSLSNSPSKSNVKGIFENSDSVDESSDTAAVTAVTAETNKDSLFVGNNFIKAGRDHPPGAAKKNSILVREDDSYAIYSDKYSQDYSSGDESREDAKPKAKSSALAPAPGIQSHGARERKSSSSNRAARRAATRDGV